MACVPAEMPEGYERPFIKGIDYSAFIDSAGGTSEAGMGDSFCLAIGHNTVDGKATLDVLREKRPPFNPEQVIEEYAALLKSYGIRTAKADAWARGFVLSGFQKHGIEVKKSERDRSAIYLDLLPYLNSLRAELLNHPRMLNQFLSLQRRTGPSGKDSIDAPRRKKFHEDCANVCAGVLVEASSAVYVPPMKALPSDASPQRESVKRFPELSTERYAVRHEFFRRGRNF